MLKSDLFFGMGIVLFVSTILIIAEIGNTMPAYPSHPKYATAESVLSKRKPIHKGTSVVVCESRKWAKRWTYPRTVFPPHCDWFVTQIGLKYDCIERCSDKWKLIQFRDSGRKEVHGPHLFTVYDYKEGDYVGKKGWAKICSSSTPKC